MLLGLDRVPMVERLQALACQVPELGHGAQPTGDHVLRPQGRLIPLK